MLAVSVAAQTNVLFFLYPRQYCALLLDESPNAIILSIERVVIWLCVSFASSYRNKTEAFRVFAQWIHMRVISSRTLLPPSSHWWMRMRRGQRKTFKRTTLCGVTKMQSAFSFANAPLDYYLDVGEELSACQITLRRKNTVRRLHSVLTIGAGIWRKYGTRKHLRGVRRTRHFQFVEYLMAMTGCEGYKWPMYRSKFGWIYDPFSCTVCACVIDR